MRKFLHFKRSLKYIFPWLEDVKYVSNYVNIRKKYKQF